MRGVFNTWAPLLALAAALGFGVAGVLLRRGLQHASPLAAAVISVSVTTGFIWILVLATIPIERLLTWKIAPFLLAGFVAPGLARLGLFTGVARIGVARSSALAAATPLFAIVLAIPFLGERPSSLLLLGAACVVAGGVLLAHRARADKSWRRRDMIFPLLAALGFGVRDNLSRWGLRDYAEPLAAAAAATVTSLAVMWLVALLGRSRMRLDPRGLGYLAASGLAEGAAYLTMWQALAQGDVSVVSPLVNSHPIFAVTLAALFLRDVETVTWRIALATALVVAGVALVIKFGSG
jgi:uncharacterized membrane protein